MSTRPWRRLSRWLHTIHVQVGVSLGALFVLLAASVGLTWYQLDLRKHDYAILNLAGQLRVTSESLLHQARTVRLDTPSPDTSGRRDLQLFYYEDLKRNTALYDRIITSFETRELDTDLTGGHDKLYCTWDEQSKSQLGRTSAIWRRFHRGLQERLGADSDHPRLDRGAEYTLEHGSTLVAASDQLAEAFQIMMEGKLAQIRLLNQLVLVLAAVLMVGLLTLLYNTLVRPLQHAMSGFARVARGDLGHQLPVSNDNEIGQMTQAFNLLSERLHALFRLTDRIGLGNNLDDSLRFVAEEFRGFLPVDWVGLFVRSADGGRWLLERQHGLGNRPLRGLSGFHVVDSPGPPLCAQLIDDLESSAHPEDGLAAGLRRHGFSSATLLPMAGTAQSAALLVFACREAGRYTPEHLEFLANVAGQIKHALDKTVFLENLVIAAVQGLATLAESRDSDTGVHLLRMATYAAIVTEELEAQGPYRDQISATFVREIYQFAPLHDIGKVGIADRILLKPGPLDQEERRDMQRHSLIGGDALRRCEVQVNNLGHNIFRMAIDIAECHHEHFDGCGYPRRLKGTDIPLSARIVAVADVFDALTSRRPYKDAWRVERALQLIRDQSSHQFDPAVVDAFFLGLPRILAAFERHNVAGSTDCPSAFTA
jgi:HD-GYP domain-containing protein (c-di-GMP phosphodiesterase class II)